MESGKDGKNELIGKCVEFFNEDYNCCESVLLSSAGLLGVDCDIIPKIASPFGGGICQRKHMCGALSGAVMALGLKYGRNTAVDDREPSYSRAGTIVEKFVEKYGSANCIDIIGYDPKDPDKIIRDKQHIRATICSPLIRQVAEWLWEELE
jgi:C_GCAxxG_C_C family probable redox protein